MLLEELRKQEGLRPTPPNLHPPTFNLQPINMSIIDREQVHKVANLARLEMTAEEEEQMTAQISSILEYFQQLSELDTTDVPPTTRAIDVSNVTRPDELQPYPDRESLLGEAPEQDGDFFKVPQILQAEE